MDVWGSRIKHLVWKVLQKTVFHICRDYVDFGVLFTWFAMALGPILMTFGGLETGLKFSGFWGLLWGTPRSWLQGRSVVIWLLSGPHCHPPNSFQQQFNMQNTSWNMQEWKDTKKQDANYENTKNQGCNMLSLQQRKQEKDRGNPPQPGGPSSRGRRIPKWFINDSWSIAML